MTKDEGTVTSSSQSTSEMNSPEQTPGASKAPSKAQSIDEERPSGPLRRDSLASLSVAREPCGWVEPEEPTWPSGWKPYACLFGGFLLMFNSWGIVNVSSADCKDENRACADLHRLTAHMPAITCSTFFLDAYVHHRYSAWCARH